MAGFVLGVGLVRECGGCVRGRSGNGGRSLCYGRSGKGGRELC